MRFTWNGRVFRRSWLLGHLVEASFENGVTAGKVDIVRPIIDCLEKAASMSFSKFRVWSAGGGSLGLRRTIRPVSNVAWRVARRICCVPSTGDYKGTGSFGTGPELLFSLAARKANTFSSRKARRGKQGMLEKISCYTN